MIGYDDALDAFGIHGVGGTLGAILTGVFATRACWDIAEGELLRWSDAAVQDTDEAVRTRREMEAAFGRPNEPA